MKINEITNTLKTFVATVKVSGTSIKTSITSESATHASLLLQRLYGAGNISSLSESVTEPVVDEATRTLSTQQLQVQSLANQEAKLKQHKKQLIARQALAKAQEKMRKASKSII